MQAKTLRRIRPSDHMYGSYTLKISEEGRKNLRVMFLLRELVLVLVMLSENLQLLSLSGMSAECGVRTT
jgi:hypothetical protein